MSCCYFRIDDGLTMIGEPVPIEERTIRSAFRDAARAAGEVLGEKPDTFPQTRRWWITVEDEVGLLLSKLDIRPLVTAGTGVQEQ